MSSQEEQEDREEDNTEIKKQKQAKPSNKTTTIDEMQQIRRLRILGHDHETIRNRLKLSRDQYYRRVAKINKIDEEYVINEFHKEAGSEVTYLQARLLGSLRNAESMATNDEAEIKDRVEAERLKLDCSVALLKLFSEGPRHLDITLQNAIITRSAKLQEISIKGYRSDLEHRDQPVHINNNIVEEERERQNQSSPDSTAREDDSEDSDDRRPSEEVF